MTILKPFSRTVFPVKIRFAPLRAANLHGQLGLRVVVVTSALAMKKTP